MIVTVWNPGGFSKPPKNPLKYALFYSIYFLFFYLILGLFILGNLGVLITGLTLLILYLITVVSLFVYGAIRKTLHDISNKHKPELEN